LFNKQYLITHKRVNNHKEIEMSEIEKKIEISKIEKIEKDLYVGFRSEVKIIVCCKCKHAHSDIGELICKRPFVNIINGEIICLNKPCINERENGDCGIDGYFFEPLPKSLIS
jgi:hypothetical protein